MRPSHQFRFQNSRSLTTFLVLLFLPYTCSGYGNLQFRDDNGNVVNSLWDRRSYESETFPDGIPWHLNHDTAVLPVYSCDPIVADISRPSSGFIALGDVDGDGDLDLVSGDSRTFWNHCLYLNNGTRYPWKGVIGIKIDLDIAGVFALGDVDGDGDLDLIVGRSYYTNVLFLNNGTSNPFEGAGGIGITSDKHVTYAIDLGDVDGDGDLDLVEGNSNQPNRLYLNNGTSNPWNGVEGMDITADAHDTRAVSLSDVDNDGDLDVIAGNCGSGIGQKNRLYLNNGTSNPFDGISGIDITSDTHSTSAIILGDIDGDGDLDLVVGNDKPALQQFNRLYLNNGTNNPWEAVEGLDIGLPSTKSRSLMLADLNQDGHLDLIEGNAHQANRYFLNNGTNNPWMGDDGIRLYDDNYNTNSIEAGDVDGDGQLDVVAGDQGGPNHLYRIDSTLDMQTIVEDAFETWEAVPESRIAFTFGGFVSGKSCGGDFNHSLPPNPALDGDNVIGFNDTFDGVLAVTYIFTLSDEFTFNDSDSSQTNNTDFGGSDSNPDIPQGTYPAGTILDADIMLGGTNWTTSGETGKIDIQSVLVHEIGHFIGLCHSTVENPSPAIMSPVLIGAEGHLQQSLQADDIAGVCSCYPNDMFSQTFGSISGTVTRTSDQTSVPGAHVVARSQTSLPEVISCYTNSDGSFVLQGLPEGNYTVRVEPLVFEPEQINEIIAEEYDTAFQMQAYPYNSDESAASVFHVTAGHNIGEVNFQVASINDPDPFEPDNTFSNVSIISTTGAAIFKTLDQNDEDFTQFEAIEGQNYIITTFGIPPLGEFYTWQLTLYLYGPDKELLLAQNCFPNAWLNFHAETSGLHYLKIKVRFGSPTSPDGVPYALSVRQTDPDVYYVSANTGADPAVISSNSEPYFINDGDTLLISIDQNTNQTITFLSSQFNNIQTATAEEVVDAINSQISGGLAKTIHTKTDTYLSIASASLPPASIQILDGATVSKLGLDTDLHRAGDGSSDSPWASICYALSCVPSDIISPADIYIADGTYYEQIITAHRVGLYGDFNPKDWSRNIEACNTIIHGGYQGSTIIGRGICQLDGLVITGGSGTYAPPYMQTDHQYLGGGIYVSGFGNALIISRCLLYDNMIQRSGYRTLGGGIFIGNQSSTSVVDCEIIYNTAEIGGGVAFDSCYALFLNNYVHDNQAVHGLDVSGSGGGLTSNTNYKYMGSEITGNAFVHNRAYRGGAIDGDNNCWDFISDNTFACNIADSDGGALFFYNWGAGGASDVQSNIITSNLSGGCGGGIYVDGYANHIEENLLIGNIAQNNGGGVFKKCDLGDVINNVFCGNDANEGGGFFASIFSSDFLHNTVVYNTGLSGGGVANGRSTSWPTSQHWDGARICNNIIAFNIGGGFVENVDMLDPELFAYNNFYANTIGNYYDADTSRWYNSDVEINTLVDNDSGDVCDNIDWDPGFISAPEGTAETIIYDPLIYKSTLIDNSAAFEPNALAGLVINPNADQNLYFYIISNTENTIKTWGDMAVVARENSIYKIFDYHLNETSENIDAGMVVNVPKDIEDDNRPFYNGYDIGADEYYGLP